MSILNFFRRNQPVSQDAVKHVVYADTPSLDFSRAFAVLGVRHGMWVMTEFGVGIVTGTDVENRVLKVNLANEDGTNKENISVGSGVVRQATYNEIPSPRRVGLERNRALAMGYK